MDILTFLDNPQLVLKHIGSRSSNPNDLWIIDQEWINTALIDDASLSQNDMTDAIEIVDYDPQWQSMFLLEASEIAKVLHDLKPVIEHVGSTAVPGLCAKPIIDMLVGVRDLQEGTVIASLESSGYVHLPDAGGPDRLFFRKGAVRTHHVHVVRLYSWTFWRHIIFRDYLISHPAVGAQYADLKLTSAKRYRFDRTAYTESKTEFVGAVLRAATLEAFITIIG